jgi:hypothetical protein
MTWSSPLALPPPKIGGGVGRLAAYVLWVYKCLCPCLLHCFPLLFLSSAVSASPSPGTYTANTICHPHMGLLWGRPYCVALIIWPGLPYSQKLKRIKMFDLSSVVKPLPLGKLESLSTAAFKRILHCESKLSVSVLIGCIPVHECNYCIFFYTETSLHREGSEVSYLMSTAHCCACCLKSKVLCAYPLPPNELQDRIKLIISLVTQFGAELNSSKWK